MSPLFSPQSIKSIIVRGVVTLVASCLIGFGSAVITSIKLNERLDARVGHLETAISEHKNILSKDFDRHDDTVAALANKTDDQERRLVRLEAMMDGVQTTLAEIRADVKQLLREHK